MKTSDCLPQLSEFIAEALYLELEVGVAGDVVVNVAVVLPFVAVGELQGTPLSLVASRVGMRWIVRKVEPFYRCVAGASVSGE